ncbi:hypothetical protein EDC18_11117 [Natranaerovirga pectinivora]|uniref:Uncharacterized protein n=1 Tax=Natranaerovirga pectinivora TaxID=682400 RepID=A0A4R3MHW9_9FIRM|nr:hypothetical protein EDC18_11117 [Natranaerovirga pectinivora]
MGTLLSYLILFFILVCILLLPSYIKYNKSNYKNASGNSFIKSIFDKGNYGEFFNILVS